MRMIRALGSRHSRHSLIAALFMLTATFGYVFSSALAANGSSQNSEKTSSEAPADAPGPDMVPASLVQIPVSSNFYSPYAFVVDKSARLLNVWQQTTTGLKRVASFPADLGKSSGEKRSRGDHKTPEGIYFLLERREGQTLDFNLYGKRAFTTDYPNFFDRLEGKTGDGIWLHAVPDHVPLTRGSRGCVVVRNDVILDISQYVKLGRTPILIQDRMDLVAMKDVAHTTTEIAQWLETWRSAWEAKNIESYMQNYADDFRSLNMNRSQWRNYKKRLAGAYKKIGVRLSRPAIFADRNRVVVRFIQEYESDRHSDVGEKVLFVKKENGGFRIIGETWSEETSAIAKQEVEAARGTTLSCTGGDSGNCIRSSATQ